jgi:hypothetical protein
MPAVWIVLKAIKRRPPGGVWRWQTEKFNGKEKINK